MLSDSSINRIKSLEAKNQSQQLYSVSRWDINAACFVGIAPDGSEKYFRFIGNGSLAIGSQISITSPEISIIGWGDTQAR